MKAKKLVYDLLCHAEDALLFRDIYWSVLEFVGTQYERGGLCFEKRFALESTEDAVVAAVDVYRLLLLVVSRVIYHWIHFSPEELAKLLLATLQVLVLSPPGCRESADVKLIRPIQVVALLDPTATWFRAWLHKVPASEQLFVALEESRFVAELLQHLSRVRPLELSRRSSLVADEVERLAAQHVNAWCVCAARY